MKLSIITVNLNNIRGLQKTMDSVVSQSLKDFEWIIIDGGSTDGSRELIEQNQGNIAYWVSEPDKGIYHAMNKGIKVATGEFLLFLNSGDRLHSNDTMLKIIPELHTEDFISGDEWWVDEMYALKKVNTNPIKLTSYRLIVGFLWHQCTFIKRGLLIDHPYNENLRIVSDWEEMLYELLINKKTYRHISIIISDYINGGISDNKDLWLKERTYVLDKYFSKKEQHTIILIHLSQYNDSEHNKQISELAFSSFVNGWYDNQEFNRLYYKFKNQIFKGPLTYSFFVALCFINLMSLATKIYKMLKSI